MSQSKLSLEDDASPLEGGNKSKLKLGLFSYPVLQAADILVHRYAQGIFTIFILFSFLSVVFDLENKADIVNKSNPRPCWGRSNPAS